MIPASESRTDGFTANLENDLYATGLYSYLQQNDLTEQPFVFTPNAGVGSTTAASWTGTVTVKLPATIGADEFGTPIASDIEWKAVGKLSYAPAADV